MIRKNLEKMTTPELIMTERTFKMSILLVCLICVAFFAWGGVLLGLICAVVCLIYMMRTKKVLKEVLSERTVTEEDNNKADTLVKRYRVKCFILIIVIIVCIVMASANHSNSNDYDYDKGYGYTEPYEGESASDYIKRQDPDLYNSIVDRYESLT